MRYFDASALVKKYVRERGSSKVRRLLAPDIVSATSRLTAVELPSALVRRGREGAFSEAARDRALAAFDRDLPALLVVEITSELVSRARALLARHPLRTGDALQLASGLYLRDELGEPVEMVAFDVRLSAAARDEGLTVL